MIGTILYPLSRAVTAVAVFFSTLFSGGGMAAAMGNAPPSLQPPDWPIWVHEHWVWENEGTQESIMQMVKDYRARGIPVGAIIIDRPWSTGVNTFDPDPERYPDLAQYVEDFHNMDVRVMMWATSVINEDASNFQEAKDKGYFLSNGKTVKWWAGKGAFIDYDNPEAVEWWHGQMDKVLDMGIDGWKIDASDMYMITLLPAWGKNGLIGWNKYKQQCYGDFFHYTREKLGKDRVISARPSEDFLDIGLPVPFTARDINFAGWVGDQDHSWEGLQAALDSLFVSALHNHVSSGSDIGGFRSGKTGESDPPKDVFLRWAQLGAFSPVMENGGGGEHRPWMFDQETADIYKKFTLLHHELIPYIYSQAAYSYERQLPTMRPQTGKYEYLLGDNILVAPFFEEGTARSVVFPRGEWIYMFDESKSYSGVKKLEFPMDEFPAFIRKGAIVPFDQADVNGLTVNVYPVNGTKAFGLYEENKPGAMLSYTKTGDALTLGSTATARPLLFRVCGQDEPASVTLDGKALAQASSLSELKKLNADGYFAQDGVLWVGVEDASAGVEITIK